MAGQEGSSRGTQASAAGTAGLAGDPATLGLVPPSGDGGGSVAARGAPSPPLQVPATGRS